MTRKEKKPRPKRTKQAVYVELPAEVVSMLDELVSRTGRKRNAEVERAIRRHYASPEPLPAPPAPLPQGEV